MTQEAATPDVDENSLSHHEPHHSLVTPPSLKTIGIGLAIAAALGWAINAFPLFKFEIPEELMMVNMYSPPAEQERFKIESDKAYWRNGLMHYALIGLAFGIVPPLVGGTVGRGRSLAIGAVLGLIAGLLGFTLALYLRRLCDSGIELPGIGPLEGIISDVLVFGLLGIMVSLPVLAYLFGSGHSETRSKAMALPVGGLLAGLVFPIIGSMIFPTQSTRDIPILHAGMLAIWLAILALFLVLIFRYAGAKK